MKTCHEFELLHESLHYKHRTTANTVVNTIDLIVPRLKCQTLKCDEGLRSALPDSSVEIIIP